MEKTAATHTDAISPLDVIVVGAGFAGLYSVHKLRARGMNVQVFEAGSDIGGTWFWNRYPGAQCDVESLEYSYGFSDALQQEWEWPTRFASQPEILRYINHVADRFDLRRSIKLNTRVTQAHYDDSTKLWSITTDAGDTVKAKYCIMASGNLSLPRVPKFPGLEQFKGDWYHTGLWPHEPIDFTGLRVGVIGTGASGIQLIPIVAKQAKHLHVFQRTPNFTVPAKNGPADKKIEKERKAQYPAWRAKSLETPFGIAGFPKPTQNALEASAEARKKYYEEKWNSGGGNISFLYAYKDLLVNKQANETASQFVRDKIDQIVKDPAVATLLKPTDHYIGTKRLPLDTNYFETFNRDNVTLIDVRSAPIEAITENGLQTQDALYPLDVIILATGFDAMTGALFDIDIQGKHAMTLKSKWEHGPRTFLGLMTADFPNMFLVTGPGSPSVKTNMVAHIEQHVDWITECIDHLRTSGLHSIEADKTREDEWVAHVNEVADGTLYPLANSWYTGANIPGKPRVFMPYVGGLDKYKVICDDIASKNYAGFLLE
jgi:cyclohexanone monooxygenase